MATHYTCDRCGEDSGSVKDQRCSVTIPWTDADGNSQDETVVLKFTVVRPKVDFEQPDLCNGCYALVLYEAARTIVAAPAVQS